MVPSDLGMNYLYGDSTTSQLKSNFLEFLRDALDFCVFVLQADAKMKQGRVQIRHYGEEAEQETQRLERFINAVQGTVVTAQKGNPESPTARTADRLTQLIADTHRQSVDAIRRMLADAIARIEAEENATRDACVNALALLIAPHDPPDTAAVTRLGLLESGQYDATLDGKAEPALEWTLELGIPDGHAWAAPMRIDRIVPHLEIRAPQLAGWITKEVKVKPIRIERHVVTEIVESENKLTFELRTEATSDLGFDFHVDFESGKVKATRIGPADDASSGDFELQDEDGALIKDLATKLRESLAGLERIPNIVATFEGADFRTLPEYIEIVDRLVAMMTPIVREISARSLTPNELVLRRLLGNDRREEIFVAKATLREKLKELPTEARALFDPLQLDPALPPKPAPAPAPPPKDEKPAMRSELPPSVPPPARAAAPPVRIPAPPTIKGLSTTPKSTPPATLPKSTPPEKAPEKTPEKSAPEKAAPEKAEKTAPEKASDKPAPLASSPSGSMHAVKPTRTIMPSGAAVPPPAQHSTVPNVPADDPDEAPQLEVGPEIEMSTDGLFDAVPESARQLVTKPETPRNEALVGALKKIMTLSKNGRGGEAYQEYATLFGSDAFAEYKAEDQRQALRLMVLAKSHPADKDAVLAAHEAALPRIQAMLEQEKTAPDLELLGVTQLYLGDADEAAKSFQAGLDIERSRNPQSDLIASLMRRVSQL
ncbi:MAG: hypothetical protein KIT84_28760 [Labilithrix sp.]|nr:hypothetical protein [Labilithrix sp.]MCW5815052.1 hypothetical protein [Labilithrix sp.]